MHEFYTRLKVLKTGFKVNLNTTDYPTKKSATLPSVLAEPL